MDANLLRTHFTQAERQWPNRPHLLRPAAVMVLLVPHQDSFQTLLTIRTDKLTHHAGQVSFPGGGCEPQDLTPLHTALRETEEELNFSTKNVEVIGQLRGLGTPSGFWIQPFVGILPSMPSFSPNPEEVASAFWLPLMAVPRTSSWAPGRDAPIPKWLHWVSKLEKRLSRSENPPPPGGLRSLKRRKLLAFTYQDITIWGATARILKDLNDVLATPDEASP